MRRLNVRFSQIEECIRTSLFAVDNLPVNPPLQRGELLLLQLVKEDAARIGKLDRRIEFALVFERVSEDPTGAISREHWPAAGKTWKFILHCSDTVPAIPFSLESLWLSRDYGGIMNALYIEPADEERIRPYISEEIRPELPAGAGVRDLLAAIRNYDKVFRLSPTRTTRVREHERLLRDPWLGDALKLFYDHKCQICVNDFKPRYGVPYADTRFLQPLQEGGKAVSTNLLVTCPNHHAIIGAAKARFDERMLAFKFPNGLVEKVVLRDHLLA